MEAILGLHSFHNLTRCLTERKYARDSVLQSLFCVGDKYECKTGDNREMSPLYAVTIEYGKLLTGGYHIVLGRKGK